MSPTRARTQERIIRVPAAALLLLISVSDVEAKEFFEGLWAKSASECLDETGPNSRTLVDLSNLLEHKPAPIFDQYENHCLIDKRFDYGDSVAFGVTCYEFWGELGKRQGGYKTVETISKRESKKVQINGEQYQHCQK